MSDWSKCFENEFEFKPPKNNETICKFDDEVKCKPPKKDAASCKPIVNVICPSVSDNQQAVNRPCLPTELVQNGGFEQPGVFEQFANWQVEQPLKNVFPSDIVYEGAVSAGIASIAAAPSTQVIRLFQNVTVPPGCFLALSFADNFQSAGNGFVSLRVRARVFYGENMVDLINIEINYNVDQAGQGFVFHQKVTDTPVPLNVSNVTVEFLVEMTDAITPGEATIWLLDGVSLRAV